MGTYNSIEPLHDWSIILQLRHVSAYEDPELNFLNVILETFMKPLIEMLTYKNLLITERWLVNEKELDLWCYSPVL